MKRTKPMIAALCFVTALLNIVIHISDYRNDRRPSGLRLVVATLSILSGVLTLLSDALEQNRVQLPAKPKAKSHADIDLDEDEFGDDIYDLNLGCDSCDDSGSCDLCFDDCIECQG